MASVFSWPYIALLVVITALFRILPILLVCQAATHHWAAPAALLRPLCKAALPQVLFLFRDKQKIDASLSLTEAAEKGTVRRLVVDTGAGPNAAHPRALPPKWRRRVKPIVLQMLVFDAIEKPLRFEGAIALDVTIAKSRVKSKFVVSCAFNTDVLLGTKFIDRRTW